MKRKQFTKKDKGLIVFFIKGILIFVFGIPLLIFDFVFIIASLSKPYVWLNSGNYISLLPKIILFNISILIFLGFLIFIGFRKNKLDHAISTYLVLGILFLSALISGVFQPISAYKQGVIPIPNDAHILVEEKRDYFLKYGRYYYELTIDGKKFETTYYVYNVYKDRDSPLPNHKLYILKGYDVIID